MGDGVVRTLVVRRCPGDVLWVGVHFAVAAVERGEQLGGCESDEICRWNLWNGCGDALGRSRRCATDNADMSWLKCFTGHTSMVTTIVSGGGEHGRRGIGFMCLPRGGRRCGGLGCGSEL